MRAFAAFVVLLFIGHAALAVMPSEQTKINYLLTQLDSPDITFIRNGEEHAGAWARKHLEEKLAAAEKPDMTVEEFVTAIASVSSQTGKPYLIRTKDGKTVEAAAWFKDKLERMPIK